ncbi:hypothetical protein BGZ95_006482 [Linnemannia exigua]|uniref:Uncharacterized protein n=1 Tax=Linnemannia exigua TaxID=604196 RepID=A0AAD4D0Y6_9FUNG|nr:hypothetical protein BGZ95_006482 [Linnemannia exigua]
MSLIGMRIWVAFVTFISLAITIASYVNATLVINKLREEHNINVTLDWRHHCSIITSVILFGIYAYSVWTRNKVTSIIQNKFLRAILVLIPAVILLYVDISTIVYARPEAFTCSHKNGPTCHLWISSIYLSLIASLFVLAEVLMSVFMTPRAKSVDY